MRDAQQTDLDNAEGPGPEEGDFRALADFRSALRQFIAVSDASALAAGLTSQRYQALLAIRVASAAGRISVGELAEQLLVKPHSAAELVNRLESAGLVRRTSDSSDRRRVLLTLTENGEKRMAELARVQLAELEQHRETLSALMQSLRKKSSGEAAG